MVELQVRAGVMRSGRDGSVRVMGRRWGVAGGERVARRTDSGSTVARWLRQRKERIHHHRSCHVQSVVCTVLIDCYHRAGPLFLHSMLLKRFSRPSFHIASCRVDKAFLPFMKH